MEISDFIFDLLHRRVRKILLEKEIKYLPDISAVNKSWQPLCDLIFVIERFKSLKILPYNYDITYSSIFNDLSLSEKKRDNLNRLKKLLINGDSKINNASSGFLPKSRSHILPIIMDLREDIMLILQINFLA